MNPSIWIQQLGSALAPMSGEYVLVGGCAAYTFDLGALQIRETRDVDIVVRASSYGEWRAQLARLAACGLRPDPQGPHVARHQLGNIPVDVVATPWAGVGENRWYDGAFEEREHNEELDVPVITPLWFLATKLEAFRDRGVADPITSKDLEDVVTLLRGHAGIWGQLDGTRSVERFIRTELRSLADRPDALALIQALIEPDLASQAGAVPLLNRLRVIEP